VNNPLFNPSRFSSISNINYPTIEHKNEQITISQEVGDIKHHLSTQIFKEDIRMLVSRSNRREIPIKLKLFAKNLPKPFEEDLRILVEDAMEG